mmetsp:Transcript_26875/g.73924  ORF Transcript_26875/g.73924 Transcript_26875/m.73924 type:complete len:266 (+) Transcript_26875:1069-1866(+)
MWLWLLKWWRHRKPQAQRRRTRTPQVTFHHTWRCSASKRRSPKPAAACGVRSGGGRRRGLRPTWPCAASRLANRSSQPPGRRCSGWSNASRSCTGLRLRQLLVPPAAPRQGRRSPRRQPQAALLVESQVETSRRGMAAVAPACCAGQNPAIQCRCRRRLCARSPKGSGRPGAAASGGAGRRRERRRRRRRRIGGRTRQAPWTPRTPRIPRTRSRLSLSGCTCGVARARAVHRPWRRSESEARTPFTDGDQTATVPMTCHPVRHHQ